MGIMVERFQAGRRILAYDKNPVDWAVECTDKLAVSSSDSVFGFLEGSMVSSGSSDHGVDDDAFDVEDEEEVLGSQFEENQAFWDNQHHLLQATLCRTSSLETGIRNVTRATVKELRAQSNDDYDYCKCCKPVTGCRLCLMREVSSRLSNAGYNSAICRSKWRSSPQTPSGEHTFLDVIDSSNPLKGEVRVIIELNFRAEFEMGRASDEYNQLINRLPEIFVSKIERLKPVIKILCTGAKKCMKDKKMHMGPWRKQKYIQAKWFSSNCQRMVVQLNHNHNHNYNYDVVPLKQSTNNHHGKASMLTMALLGATRKAVAAA